MDLFCSKLRTSVGGLRNRERRFILERFAWTIRRDAACEHDARAVDFGSVGTNILGTIEIGFKVLCRPMPWLPVYRSQVDDEIGLGRQFCGNNRLPHIHCNELDAAGSQSLLQERTIALIAWWTDIDKNDFVCQLFAQEMLCEVCPDETRSTKDDYSFQG